MRKVSTALFVYYDRSCPICREEIEALKSIDSRNVLHLIDCSADDFKDAEALQQGLDQETLKNTMHVRNAAGQWHAKTDAFIAMYEAVGFDSAARLLQKRGVRSAFERLYPLFVRHRHKLKYTGVHKVMPWLIRRAAIKQAKTAASCSIDRARTKED